ncbi:ferredoxin [Nocardioides sp. KR10-350]|uniref:ferredoxin n=1 Tax=Nocardioides cheoyonin TaxID=3156615 RepID=UPI0032B3C727
MSERRRRLVIDWTRCDGHGLCARLWPERIAVDDWGFPLFRAEVADAETPDARRVVSVCPRLALRLERD